MSRQIAILDSAKEEFRDIKRHVKKEFGESTWNAVNAEYKAAFLRIEDSPESDMQIGDLADVGIANVKYMLVRQTRIVYAFDAALILVHMAIHARRDFRSHLFRRLLGR